MILGGNFLETIIYRTLVVQPKSTSAMEETRGDSLKFSSDPRYVTREEKNKTDW